MRAGYGTRLAAAFLGAMVGCSSPPAPAPPAPQPAPVAVQPEPVATSTPGPSEPSPLSEEALRTHVEALASPALRGRGSGTEDEAAAAALIVSHLKRWGIAPASERYRQTFKLRPDSGRESANVIASLPGHGELASEVVVFGAHYDHLGVRDDKTYFGAEDNASGVAVVLEAGRALKLEHETATAPRREVLLIFFGAEEMGLIGSRHYVRNPVRAIEDTAAMVNIDMIGRPLGDRKAFALFRSLVKIDPDASIGVLGTADRPVLRSATEAACAASSLQLWAAEDLPGPVRRYVEALSQGRGDSFSFEDVGVPALFFGAGESDDYHQPTDTADKLHYPLLQRRAQAITDVVRRLALGQRPQRSTP